MFKKVRICSGLLTFYSFDKSGTRFKHFSITFFITVSDKTFLVYKKRKYEVSVSRETFVNPGKTIVTSCNWVALWDDEGWRGTDMASFCFFRLIYLF